MGAESSSGDSGIWQRIRQHKLLEWGLAYLGAALAIAHGAELVGHTFAWPESAQRWIIGILIVGFPLALTAAWYHGHRALPGVTAGELLIASILLVVGAGVLILLVRAPAERDGAVPGTGHAHESTAQGTAEGAARGTAEATAGPSLAVLPFVNMSGDKDQEYFSDGLSEELLNQIAQVKGLRVIARTSSFAFKGKNEDLRVVGEKLGAAYILEGSVRKDREHLRITTQLINSRDGIHIWSRSFDGELKDIFTVQEQIAAQVATALSVSLGVGDMPRAKGGTTNLDAYDKFLQARKLSAAEGYENLRQAAPLFREAVALDPNFSRAWSDLYGALQLSLVYFPEQTAQIRKELEGVAAQAERLAPDTSAVQLILALSATDHHAWGKAEQAFDAARRLAAPSENQVLNGYSAFLAATGRVREAIPYSERALRQDPLNLAASTWLQITYALAGHADLADAEYERSKSLEGDHQVNDYHALIRLLRRNAEPERIDAQFKLYHSKDFNAMPLTRYLMAHWRDRVGSLAPVRAAYADPANQNVVGLQVIADFADYLGDKDLALTALRQQYVDNSAVTVLFIWAPYVTGLRADERFKQILRDMGLADFYRSSGKWGDFCQPAGQADFSCR